MTKPLTYTSIWQTWMYLAVPVLLYGGERILRALRSSYKSVKLLKVLLIILFFKLVLMGFELLTFHLQLIILVTHYQFLLPP